MKGIRQHYVPKFYLKNFGDQIYQYDKETRKVSRCMPQNVAFQRNFYADSGNDDASKLEGWMSQFEGRASAVISTIVETENIAGLSDTDRTTLCDFVAFQFARTPEFREWRHDMVQSVLDALVHRLGVTGWRYAEREEHAGATHLASMLAYMYWARPYLLQMKICLRKNYTPIPLWTSDNPVVRYNELTDKLGPGSPGVVFQLPLSSKILLMFYDTTGIDLLNDRANAAGSTKKHWALAYNNIQETADMVKQNVIYANHLQARFSTRFIFSTKQRFPMMKAFFDRDGGYKQRTVFDDLGPPGSVSNDNAILDITVPDPTELVILQNAVGVDDSEARRHNLQNALLWYQKHKTESDMQRRFIHLCKSLDAAIALPFCEATTKDEFDASTRRLTGRPTLSLDKFRHIYCGIHDNRQPNQGMGVQQLSKHVEEMLDIVTMVICGRIIELRTGKPVV